MRAGVYARISHDRTGAGLGVERQEQDCRALCERLGWKVAEVYCDNDVSAYSGKTRPDWERLLVDIRAGDIDAIVCWHVDRLTRTPRELEDVISFAERRGLELATCTGQVDLSTPTGKMIARILGATARQESEHKGERQRRQRRQDAEAGRVSGGGTRAYGYDDDRVTVREAEVIRESARRVLAGESLSSLCRDLQARDVRTPIGGYWQPRTIRRMLGAARISGRREHRPVNSHVGHGAPLVGEITGTAVWPAIISAEDSDRLRWLLSRPERRTSTATGRSYLLSGILRCAHCGTGMAGRPRRGIPRYVCPGVAGTTSCGRTTTLAAPTDELIRDMVLVALEGPALRDHLAQQRHADPALVTAVDRDRAKLLELAEAWAEDGLPMAEWKAAREIVEQRLQHNETRLQRVSGPDPLGVFVGTYPQMSERWDVMNLSQRRAVIAAVIEKIVVHPGTLHRRWEPDRFEPIWR